MYILEFTKTVDSNGDWIPVDDSSIYQRLNNHIYDDYNSANIDRIKHMEIATNIYIRVSEV